MAVTFIGAGSLAGNATTNSQAIGCHANTEIGDILICQLINKSVTANAFSPPDGTWSTVIATEVNDCTTAADDHQYGLYWKRATAAGAQNFTFTKATDDNVLFAGVISSWRGCKATGSPLDATAALRTETVGAADTVSFPAYDPTSAIVHVVFMAYYGNDLTTFAAAMSADTNPDCTTRYDLESSTGTDCTLACTSGDNDGSNVAARTWASVSTTDAGSTGVVFALVRGSLLTASPVAVPAAGVSTNLKAGRKITASPVDVPVTGKSVSLKHGYTLTASPATVPVAGQSITLKAARKLVGSPVDVPVNGQETALKAARKLTVSPADVAVTGQEVELTYTPVAAGARLDVSPASVDIVGQSVDLRADRKLTASPGTVPVTGQGTALRAARKLSASPGTVATVGQSVSLRASRKLAASPVTVPIAGASVSLQAARQLPVSPGDVAVTGQQVTLTYTPVPGSFILTVDPATVAIVGQEVSLTYAPVAATQEDIPLGGGTYQDYWKSVRADNEKRDKRWKKRRRQLEKLSNLVDGIEEELPSEIPAAAIARLAQAAVEKAIERLVEAPPAFDDDLAAEVHAARLAVERAQAAVTAYLEDQDEDEDLLLLAA